MLHLVLMGEFLFFPQALVPVTIEVEVPFELHRYIIGQKGSGIRKMMDEFEVRLVEFLSTHGCTRFVFACNMD